MEHNRRIVKPDFDFPSKGWLPSGESGTKILITDVATSEFDVASKWPKLDASGYLILEQVIGNVPGLNATGNFSYSVQTKTAHYQSKDNEAVLANATAAPITIVLPEALSASQVAIKKTDSSANAVTITPAGGVGTIDGAGTLVIAAQYTAYTLISDGANWHII